MRISKRRGSWISLNNTIENNMQKFSIRRIFFYLTVKYIWKNFLYVEIVLNANFYLTKNRNLKFN